MDIWEHISGLYGIPGSYYWHSRQTCDLCLLPEGYSIPFKHLGREHVPVDGMWALKGFFLSHTNSWRCFFNFEDAQKASLRPCFEPCLRPDQTWETTRFREVERQGLTQESCHGLFCRKGAGQSGLFPRQCAAQARKAYVPLLMREPSRQPKPRAVQDALELWVEGCALAVWYFSVCSGKTLP